MINPRRIVKNKLAEKQGIIQRWPAVLGNGNGVVDVPGRAGYVYVQLAGQTTICYNRKITAQHGLPVIVGYDPKEPRLFQVLDVHEAAASLDPSATAGMRAHGTTHRYGGTDPVWIELLQFLPLLPYPLSTGVGINIYRGLVWTGSAFVIVAAQSVDLSSYVPSTTGKALFALVTITDSGSLAVTVGSEVDVADLAVTDIPAAPSGTVYAICAVRLYEGMTAVQTGMTNTDIVDLRFPGYSVGGSDASTAADITVDTSDFTRNLSSTDTTVQAALASLDQMTAGSGTGDVTGPASSTAGHMAGFADATGKVLMDIGEPGSGSASSLASVAANLYLSTHAI